MPIHHLFFSLILISLSISLSAQPFQWPEGKKAAISLSFDDARLTNIDNGLPLFKKYGTRVTYYVNPPNMQPRLEGWKQAVKDGHEIGNHTIHHPCTGNFEWSREKALENYTLASMRRELIEANQQIYEMLGVVPRSFAYTCGQTFVGRGANTRSYVPLVDELFVSGRGWMDEAPNDPMFADAGPTLSIEIWTERILKQKSNP
ncbi:MAG: polysaccharide deacetylase family protein [Bacteroidia bacterium]